MGMVEPPKLSGASVKRSHGRAARRPRLAIGDFFVLGADGIVSDANLAAVSRVQLALDCAAQTAASETRRKLTSDEACAEHGRPLWGKSVALKWVGGEGDLEFDFLGVEGLEGFRGDLGLGFARAGRAKAPVPTLAVPTFSRHHIRILTPFVGGLR